MRTTFAASEGNLEQIVHSAQPISLPRVDLSGLSAERREREALRLTIEEAWRPFDLELGPLLRAVALRIAGEDHAVLLTAHHIVFDDWSRAVLLREVSALYNAYYLGRPSPLPELAIQYADFSVWQRRWLQGANLERQLAYWRSSSRGPALLSFRPTGRVLRCRPPQAAAWLWGSDDICRSGSRLASRLGAPPPSWPCSPFSRSSSGDSRDRTT